MEGLLRDAVALLLSPGKVAEVRALADKHTHSGYFSDLNALIRAVEPLDTDTSVIGTYVSLNDVTRRSSQGGQTGSRCACPATTQPRATRISCGDAGFPSTSTRSARAECQVLDEEHGLALAKAGEIAAWLASLGFPGPVTGDSGNGGRPLRMNLPNNEPATLLVRGCLAALDVLFSDRPGERGYGKLQRLPYLETLRHGVAQR